MHKYTESFNLDVGDMIPVFIVPETILLAGINAWKVTHSNLRLGTYSLEDCEVTVQCDWRPLAELYIDAAEDTIASGECNDPQVVIRRAEEMLADPARTKPKRVAITCEVQIEASKELNYPSRSAKHYLEQRLYEVFLALNLCSPGCCDFL